MDNKDKLIAKLEKLVNLLSEGIQKEASNNMPMLQGLRTAKEWNILSNEIAELKKQVEPITDADIEAWADTKERRLTSYHMGLQAGAKAMRDGEIKHLQSKEK